MEHLLRQQIEKIVKLTDEEFTFVLTHFTHRDFKKHQYVVQAGNTASSDYFVLKYILYLLPHNTDHCMFSNQTLIYPTWKILH